LSFKNNDLRRTGPEGRDAGGTVVTAGAPEEIIKNKKSYTAKFLKEKLVDA